MFFVFFVFCFSLLGLFLCYQKSFWAYPNLCYFLVFVRQNLDGCPQCKKESTNRQSRASPGTGSKCDQDKSFKIKTEVTKRGYTQARQA